VVTAKVNFDWARWVSSVSSRESVGGEEDFFGGDGAAIGVERDVRPEGGALNGSVFEEENTGVIGGAGETADNFTGIYCAAGNFFYGAETAGVGPTDGRVFECGGAAEFVGAGESEVGIDI
jgi:hypothetical protein